MRKIRKAIHDEFTIENIIAVIIAIINTFNPMVMGVIIINIFIDKDIIIANIIWKSIYK
jgi:hypothetical protein